MRVIKYNIDTGYYISGINSILDLSLNAYEIEAAIKNGYRVEYEFQPSDYGEQIIIIRANKELGVVAKNTDIVDINYETRNIIMVYVNCTLGYITIKLYDRVSALKIMSRDVIDNMDELDQQEVIDAIRHTLSYNKVSEIKASVGYEYSYLKRYGKGIIV